MELPPETAVLASPGCACGGSLAGPPDRCQLRQVRR